MNTASGLGRIAACPGSVALAKAHLSSQYADEGNVRHADAESAALDGRLDDLPPRVRALIEPDAQLLPEVAVAYNWRTGKARMLGRGITRDYPVDPDSEIPGTIDLLVINPSGRLVVVDYKGHEDVGEPDQNVQVMLYGLAVARIYGANEVTLAVSYIGAGTEDARTPVVTVDCFDLAAYATKVTRIIEAANAEIGKAIPDVRESRHCKWCPSKPYCGAKNALLVQVASGGLAVIGDTAMTVDRAREAYREIERIEQLVKDARKRLEVYVDDNGPIDLGEGRFFGRYRRPGNEKLDGDIAIDAIRSVLPDDQADTFEATAIEYSTSKAAIERAAKEACGPGAKRGAATKLARQVVEKVRELGGVTAADTFPLGEYTGESRGVAKDPVDIEAVDRALKAAG